MSFAMSDTCGSSRGSMPRNATPVTLPPCVSSAWASTYGAALLTDELRSDSPAVCFQSGIVPVGEKISMCASTASMRSRTSLLNPFITDSTMISAATPSAMPDIDATAMNEMKPLPVVPVVRLPTRVYRNPICHSYGTFKRCPLKSGSSTGAPYTNIEVTICDAECPARRSTRRRAT
ncbi:hypothetical protein BGV60_31270 [Burkholderia ubonensis]|nr:hypothetical protein BGV60_31270 [Burkholderia ubonensis]